MSISQIQYLLDNDLETIINLVKQGSKFDKYYKHDEQINNVYEQEALEAFVNEKFEIIPVNGVLRRNVTDQMNNEDSKILNVCKHVQIGQIDAFIRSGSKFLGIEVKINDFLETPHAKYITLEIEDSNGPWFYAPKLSQSNILLNVDKQNRHYVAVNYNKLKDISNWDLPAKYRHFKSVAELCTSLQNNYDYFVGGHNLFKNVNKDANARTAKSKVFHPPLEWINKCIIKQGTF